MVQKERDVRTLRAADMVEIADTVEMGGFLDKLEHLVADLECTLLETLTPWQFAVVQNLVQATQILTEARFALDATAPGQIRQAPRARTCRWRPIGGRVGAARRPRPKTRLGEA
jgi:hypothetical protein